MIIINQTVTVVIASIYTYNPYTAQGDDRMEKHSLKLPVQQNKRLTKWQ